MSGEVTRSPCVTDTCRCNCGYTCGGPGICKLGWNECLNVQGHFVKDCDHEFNGPVIEFDDGMGGTVTCSKCNVTSMDHDCRVGP